MNGNVTIEKKSSISVKVSKPFKENKQKKINDDAHELKLKEMMISKKHSGVYKKIKFGIKRQAREKDLLLKKRCKIENSRNV